MKITLLAFFFSLFVLTVPAQQNPDGSEAIESSEITFKTKPNISIYPNPATNFISVDNAEEVKSISIFNLVGRKLKSFENIQKDEHYDVSSLSNGMYLVQVVDHSNKIITTQRISKR